MENSSCKGNKKHIVFQNQIKQRYQDISLLILPSDLTTVAGLRFDPHTRTYIYINLQDVGKGKKNENVAFYQVEAISLSPPILRLMAEDNKSACSQPDGGVNGSV